jgi:hypothetical protein
VRDLERLRHPDTDPFADTIEFTALELEPALQVRYTLRDKTGLRLPHDFAGDLVLRIGYTAHSSPCHVAPVNAYPRLLEPSSESGAREKWVVLQPDVIASGQSAGWVALGQELDIGRHSTPQLRLGPDVSRSRHCVISVEEDWIFIDGWAHNGTDVIVDAANRLSYYTLE